MMQGSVKKTSFGLYCLTCCTLALSQTNSIPSIQKDFPFQHIEYYSSEQGLNGSEVYWMTQDKLGFMWFVTDIGLNRFDGYSFRSYVYSKEDPNSISTGSNWGITEDKNGNIWIPSYQSGFFSFDPHLQKWSHYKNEADISNSFLGYHTFAISNGDNGQMWIGTTQGLERFDTRTKSFVHYGHKENDPASISNDFIICMVLDSQYTSKPNEKTLWLFNGSPRIDCFNTETGKVTGHYDFPFIESLRQWIPPTALNISQDHKEIIWIGSNDAGIYGFSLLTKKFVRIKMEPHCKSGLHIHGFYSVLEDHSGNIWTTNDNNEIVYYNTREKKFYYQKIVSKNIFLLALPSMIYEDRSHRIWIGTNEGLIAVDLEQKEIYSFQQNKNDPYSIAGNRVFGIYRAAGKLFVNSLSIQVFDIKTGRFHIFEGLKNMNTDGAWTVYQDSKHKLWFTGEFGIISYDTLTKKNLRHQLRTDTGNLYTPDCVGLAEDKQGRYWTANFNDGLYCFDPETNKTRVFSVQKGTNSISTNSVVEIFFDSKGTLYTCGWEGGFITFDPYKELFTIFRHNAKDTTSISQETAHSFLESRNGLIWFCTLGGGIGVFDPGTKKFRSFTTSDGLIHNCTEAIVEDKKGNYWVTSIGGISRFSPPENPFSANVKIQFRNYNRSDGLPSNVFNQSSAFCDRDGELFFGTSNSGLIYFHPDSLKDNPFIPPVYITDFRLMNRPGNVNDSNSILQSAIEFTKEVKLNFRQNIISFSFSALNYIHPEKNQYAYKLEGFDKDWIHTDASKRFASYTNLNPGKYIFKVKGSNNDGKWNETPTELKITITPPFWQTTWFRILVIGIIAGGIYLFYRYRISQILRLQKIRNKIASDLHDDIGSTLNSISVYSEVARKHPDDRDKALLMIGENSRKIIDSLSDIVWTINPQNDSFDKIIFRMRSLSYNLLKAKKIECSFKSDETLNELSLPMEIRRNMYLIFKEALNNLVKYSSATRASILLLHESKNVSLIIRDNGTGFDRAAAYNGNGINNMLHRAKEIGAELLIESAPGSGTNIELNLKV